MKKEKLEKLLLTGTLALISVLNPANAYCQEEQKENKKIDLNLEEALKKKENALKFNEFRIGDLNVLLSDSPRIFHETVLYKDASLFTEIYYQKDNEENIIGTNARIGINNLELDFGGKIFIPDSSPPGRYKITVGISIGLKLFKFGVGYNMDIDACNGKRGDSFSFNASFSL